MKKIYLLLTSVLIVAAACGDNDESVFDESSTVRLQKVLDECAAAVLQPEWGWKMLYNPDPKAYGGYNVLMKFEDETRVRMLTDFVAEETVSTYSFNGSQGAVLTFDTQGGLHHLADPALLPLGTGMKGEFEFIIQQITPDSLVFEGKKYGQRIVFRHAEQEDWETRMAAYRNNIDLLSPSANAPYFRGLTMNQTAVNLSYIPESRTVNYAYSDPLTRDVYTATAGVYGTEEGVRFEPAIRVNGVVLDRMRWNPTLRVYETATPGVVGRLRYSHQPPFPFYGSIAQLRAGSNLAGIPKIADIDLSQGLGGLLNLLTIFELGSYMCEDLNSNYTPMVMGGMKQMRISWSLDWNGTEVGPWLTFYGGLNLLQPSDQTVDYRLAMTELRPEGDQFVLAGDVDVRRQPDQGNSQFQQNIEGTTGFAAFYEFFTDPAGFTVVPETSRVFTLVSLSDSRRWIRLTKE